MARPATDERSVQIAGTQRSLFIGTLQKLIFNTERCKVRGKSVFSGPGIGFHGFFWSLPDYFRTGVLSGQNPLLSALNQAAASTSRAVIILA